MSAHLSMNVTLAIDPVEGQTNEEAAAEFLELFKEYVQSPDGPLFSDYGPHAWGGYEGPTVTDATVEELTYDFDTVVAMIDVHPVFLMRYITEGDLPSTGTTAKDCRIRHSDLVEFQNAREEGKAMTDAALRHPDQLTLLGDDGDSPA